MSKPKARLAIFWPMVPRPKMPSFLPDTLGGCGMDSRHTPARHWMSSVRIPRTMPMSSPKAWSATQSSLVPAPLAVAMPRDFSSSSGRPS